MSNISVYLNQILSQARQILRQNNSPAGDLPGMGSAQGGPVGSGNMAGGLGALFQQQAAGREARMSLGALFRDESFRMNPQEVSQFLKETMKLPQEMRFLLLMLALEGSPQELKGMLNQSLKDLLAQNLNQLNVPLDDLQALLGKNSQEATDKLMKLLQANQMSQTQSGQQLTEMLGTLGKLGEKVKASPAQALETLMLLYIPWYPLAAQQDLHLSFELGEGGEEGGDKDISVVIYLETNALGRFKIIVQELEPLQVMATVLHEPIADPLMKDLEEALNEKLATDGLPAAVFESGHLREKQTQGPAETAEPDSSLLSAEVPAGAGFARATRQADEKRMDIQKGEHISLLVLNCAYALARWIFEADEQNRRLQKNK